MSEGRFDRGKALFEDLSGSRAIGFLLHPYRLRRWSAAALSVTRIAEEVLPRLMTDRFSNLPAAKMGGGPG